MSHPPWPCVCVSRPCSRISASRPCVHRAVALAASRRRTLRGRHEGRVLQGSGIFQRAGLPADLRRCRLEGRCRRQGHHRGRSGIPGGLRLEDRPAGHLQSPSGGDPVSHAADHGRSRHQAGHQRAHRQPRRALWGARSGRHPRGQVRGGGHRLHAGLRQSSRRRHRASARRGATEAAWNGRTSCPAR